MIDCFKIFYKNSGLILYLIVGALATLVEWICFYIFANIFEIYYLFATIIAIIISTFSNWFFGRLIAFRKAKRQNLFFEIGKIYLVSIAGLLMNLVLMKLFVDFLDLEKMPSKIIATCIVFFYNYFARKIFIYKKTK